MVSPSNVDNQFPIRGGGGGYRTWVIAARVLWGQISDRRMGAITSRPRLRADWPRNEPPIPSTARVKDCNGIIINDQDYGRYRSRTGLFRFVRTARVKDCNINFIDDIWITVDGDRGVLCFNLNICLANAPHG